MMKEMKRVLYIAALLAVFACSRTGVADRDAQIPAGERYLTFEANLGQMSKSYFMDEDEADPAKKGTLYWDEQDRVVVIAALQMGDYELDGEDANCSELINKESLALIAANGGTNDGSYIGAEFTKYAHCAVAVPTIQDDPSKAVFVANTTATAIMPERGELHNPYYEFLALYPADRANPFRLICMDGDQAAIAFPINIAHEQNGKDFGRYHVCLDAGWDSSDDAVKNGFYSAEKVISGEKKVVFDHFQPATSLLRFNIRTDSATPVKISRIEIKSLGNTGNKLSGDSWVSTWADNVWIIPDRWDGETFDNVVVRFDDPVEVSSTAVSDYFYAVVLPVFGSSMAPSFANHYNADETFEFTAYDIDGNLVFRTVKETPSTGLRAGQRYDFTLVLEQIPVPDNEIWYETVSGDPVVPFNGRTDFWQGASSSAAVLVSNTYEDGKGILLFDRPLKLQDANAFEGVTDLKSIRLPNTITTLNSRGFYGCTALQSVSLPKSLSYIGASCFYGCSSLTSVMVPANESSSGPYGYPIIGGEAFAYCTSLETATFLTSNYPPNLQTPDPFSNTTCLFYVQPTVYTTVQGWNNGACWVTYRDAGRLRSL